MLMALNDEKPRRARKRNRGHVNFCDTYEQPSYFARLDGFDSFVAFTGLTTAASTTRNGS
jgi:hypothetical protein